MTGERQNFSPARMGAFILPAWIVFVWLMYSINWHPVRLMSEMLPVVPVDLAAAVYRLTAHGLPELGMLALVLFSAIGLGGLVLRLFLPDIRGARLTLSLGLGLVVISYLTLLVGLAKMYNSAGRTLLLAVVTLMAVYGVVLAAKDARGLKGHGRPAWPDTAFFTVLALVSVFLAAKATRPAVFYDAVTYHLGVPNYYLQEGGISYIPYDSYSNFPFLAEMLYTLGMLVYGLKLAQLTSVAVFIASVLLVYRFTRRFMPNVQPALPAAFFLLTPAFMENSVLFINDIHLLYYSLLVVYCFFELEVDNRTAWVVLMGIFTGACIGTKYIASVSVCVPATLAVAYIAYKDRAKGERAALMTLLLFALPALAVASPWLIKNQISTGNPFYPAFYGVFGGPDMTERLYTVHKEAAGHTTISQSVGGLFVYPWEIFMAAPDQIIKRFGFASYLGPTIVLFAPALLFVKSISPVVKKLCLYSALLFVMWSMAFSITRFLYPAVAILVIVSAYAVVETARYATGVVKVSMALAVAGTLTLGLCLGFYLPDRWADTYGFEHAGESDYQYLVRRADSGGSVMLQSVPVYEYINKNTPPNARVLIIGDAQHLYIERRHLYAYLSEKSPYDVFGQAGGDSDVVAERLKSEGVTHVVYNPDELRRLQKGGYTSFPEKDNARIEEFLNSGHAQLVSAARLHNRPVFGFEIK